MNYLKPILAWVLCLSLVSCSSNDNRPLKVATNLWPGYEPLYLAQYLGVFHQDIEVIQLSSATEVMRAMAHGNLDAAALTLDEVISLRAGGLDIEPILVLDYSRGGDAIVTLQPKRDSLVGMRVGVENTALGAIVLSEALNQAGLTFDDVVIINVSPDEHEKALLQEKLDAVVTFEPVRTRLLRQGAKVLFDTRQAPDLVVDMLVARRSALEARPQRFKQLVAGYLKARHYMQTNQSEAEVFFSKRLSLDRDQLQQAFEGLYLPTLQDNREWFSGQPSTYHQVFERILGIMQARGLVEGDPLPGDPPSWLLEVSG
ncbi:MAG: hypothetical protein CMK83_07130 [Pseudomonadales bacterium]|jgi:NitT/TauT family transport system substrate-binding protein|uniref:ABC transporter substrate-binding protein n=1 Tax=Ketobacter sp. GenoA1 TaxID=2072747 RepID=UPI000C9510D2|nr:ABC transporter substrate-binding protein [Ketobacter sp. GenoA1]MAQ23978.1 hypothetical protein [Pseudomonadales bacterium]MEC8813826.1 ABC transporter substrate-binding protein [Pseudomonadota bacterium]RLT96481.1 MAG: hypothetical protein D9N15_10240 [Ketobacter sp.]TNC88487.1 MAG: hypothetical protein CSH49_11295 [Alcanivorax sp.]HAG96563.1 hypothetical protein [Gammaproteobacteria bacterium]|tara:strand:+ start:2054 stop:2998 length:945 start_codon:yes stop_codon:yes gene_type:complete